MTLDLKPLSNEVIHKMEYTAHDLWVIKIEDEVFGPFEIGSLKDYAKENQNQFNEALASRMDANDWHPFYSHAPFQEIKIDRNGNQKKQIVFWILNLGQKAGPHSKAEIDSKIEMELLNSNDLISCDDGHTWQKIYQIEEFHHQLGGSDSLPIVPIEESFVKSKQEVNDWLNDDERKRPHQGIAAMAHLGQIKDKASLNLEEIDLKSLNETEVSRSLKWAVPYAVAGLGALAWLGSYLMSPPSSKEITEADDQNEEKVVAKTPDLRSRPSQIPQVNRNPANYQIINHNQRSGLTQSSSFQSEPYQSHTEIQYNEPDPMGDPASDTEPGPSKDLPQEHSLVSNNQPSSNEGESLDQMMSNPGIADQPPEQPVIEEASDF